MFSALASIPFISQVQLEITRLDTFGRNISDNVVDLFAHELCRHHVNVTHTRGILTSQCCENTHSVDLQSAGPNWEGALCAAKVLRSAWIPAPPEGSEPAIDRTAGGVDGGFMSTAVYCSHCLMDTEEGRGKETVSLDDDENRAVRLFCGNFSESRRSVTPGISLAAGLIISLGSR